MKMRYKQIVSSVFVFFIFNLFALGPFSGSGPAPSHKPGPGLYAQEVDLVKLQKEEEERKKKTKKSTLVVTNDSIKEEENSKKSQGVVKIVGTGTQKDGASAGNTGIQSEPVNEIDTPADSSGKNPDDAGTVDRQSKQYWQDRVNKLLDDIEATEADIKSNQWELNQLESDLQAEDLYEKRLEIQKKMDELGKLIPEQQQKLIDLNKQMEDLEDQARRENIPAGWLRVDRPEPTNKQQEGQSVRKEKG
jgi:hypothetical protein